MKSPDRKIVSELEALPNIGKTIGKELRLIGIEHPLDLIGQDAFLLYDQLCKKKGQRVDHCVIDVFMSVIDYMEGGEAKPWWMFTGRRKQLLKEKI